MRRVIVLGGYGVFGSRIARALAESGTPPTIAGRDARRAEALAQSLGGSWHVVDVADAEGCRRALAGHDIAVHCAGPFHEGAATVLDACLDAGCHYVDIADDRGYVALVRRHGLRFAERGLAAVYGCSSLPGISGALALRARAGTAGAVQRVRVTLFIGNNNPKGSAAVQSLLSGLGRPIAAPQGRLWGFHDREVVLLPPPFGRRGVFNFDSPDYDLLDAPAVTVKLGFELRLATYAFALLARLRSGYGTRANRLLAWPGRLLGGLGCSGGAVLSELFGADGSVRRAALAARTDGQRMAALPCAFVVGALLQGTPTRLGAQTAYECLGADALLRAVQAAGFELHDDATLSS